MTDGALKDGDPKKFMDVCHSREQRVIQAWAERLASRFDADSGDVADFLAALTIQCNGLAPRDKLGTIVAYQDLRPYLREVRLDVERHGDYYERIHSAVRQRCSTASADPWDGGELLEASRNPKAASGLARLLARRLDRQMIVDRLHDPGPREAILDASPTSIDHTRMVIKLERGCVAPSTISAAKRLRASWYALESARKARAPGTRSGFEDLRARVLLVAADAESRVDRERSYGQSLFDELRQTLTLASVSGAAVEGLSEEQLLGLAFQLTDECEIFWSERFDVDGELA